MEKEQYINLLKTIMESHFPSSLEHGENSIYGELEGGLKDELPADVHAKVKRLHDLALMAKEADYTGQHEDTESYRTLNPTEEEKNLAIYPDKLYDEIHKLLSSHLPADHAALRKIKKEGARAASQNKQWHRGDNP